MPLQPLVRLWPQIRLLGGEPARGESLENQSQIIPTELFRFTAEFREPPFRQRGISCFERPLNLLAADLDDGKIRALMISIETFTNLAQKTVFTHDGSEYAGLLNRVTSTFFSVVNVNIKSLIFSYLHP
ncbi:MAG: hypothetical protein QM796_02485 [Chthoniobacteraceae bacterium]